MCQYILPYVLLSEYLKAMSYKTDCVIFYTWLSKVSPRIYGFCSTELESVKLGLTIDLFFCCRKNFATNKMAEQGEAQVENTPGIAAPQTPTDPQQDPGNPQESVEDVPPQEERHAPEGAANPPQSNAPTGNAAPTGGGAGGGGRPQEGSRAPGAGAPRQLYEVPGAAADNNNAARARNVNQQNPLLNVRDRLFHALFYRIALAYARAIPRPVRRFLEFAILLKVMIYYT